MGVSKFKNVNINILSKLLNVNKSLLAKILNSTIEIIIEGNGYFGGGNSDIGFLNQIHKLFFSSKTISLLNIYLVIARGAQTSSSTSQKGYWFAGSLSGSRSDEIDGVIFSNDSLNNPSSVLSSVRQSLACVHNGVSYSYPGYGYSWSNENKIEKFNYSNETISNLTNFGSAKHWLGGVSINSAGYYLGGFYSGSTFFKEIIKLTFSNDSVSNLGDLLPVFKAGSSSLNSSNSGYYLGDYHNGETYSKKGVKINFQTEAFSELGEVLSYGFSLSSMKAPNNNQYGYMGGGTINSSGTRTKQIQEFNFTTEYSSIIQSELTTAPDGNSGFQSGGYL